MISQFTSLNHLTGVPLQALEQAIASLFQHNALVQPELSYVYDTHGELGRGGMGVVYSVQDKRLMRAAALKILSDEGASEAARRRFIREAQITAQLTHPNIPPVYSLGLSPQNQLFMVMKRVEGETLKDSIKAHKAASTLKRQRVELLSILVKVSEAVAYAHERRIVHRDLKPANIMVGAFGEVLLMDWGLARSLDEAEESLDWGGSGVVQSTEGLTQAGSFLGTAGYSAPEQIEGMEIDCGVDVFALGVILVEILTGEPAISGATDLNRISATLKGRFSGPRDLDPSAPEELDWLARQAMHEDSEQRPSAEDFGAALKAWLAGQELADCPYSLWQRMQRAMRRHPWALVNSAVLCLAVVFTAALMIDKHRRLGALEREGSQAQRDVQDLSQRQRAFADAEASLERRDHKAMQLQIEDAVQRAQRSEVALVRAARLYLRAGRRDDARVLLNEAVTTYSPALHAHYELYLLDYDPHSKSSAEATRGFAKRVFEAKSKGAYFWVCQALKLRDEQQFDQAIEAFQKAELKNRRLWLLYIHRGLLYKQRGECTKALSDLRRAIELKPESAYGYLYRATLWQQLGQYRRALIDVNRAMTLQPEFMQAAVVKANTLESLKDYEGCLKTLNEVLEWQPNFAAAYERRGAARLLLKDYQAAIEDFNRALERDPKMVKAAIHLGLVHYEQGNYQQAEKHYSHALDLDPSSARAYNLRGMVRRILRQNDLAYKDFGLAIKNDPEHSMAYFCRGSIEHIHRRDLSAALRDYNKAIELQPEGANVYLNRASIYSRKKQWKLAQLDYERVIELVPKHTQIVFIKKKLEEMRRRAGS